KKDAERSASPRTWRGWAYFGTLVVGGLALFLPIPWLASYGLHADFTASVFIVAATVNIHHFMIDGVVWKLRNPRVGKVLVGAPAAGLSNAPAPATDALPRSARSAPRLIWQGAAIAALIALAVLDQWHYVLAIGTGNRPRLESATKIVPRDTGTLVR